MNKALTWFIRIWAGLVVAANVIGSIGIIISAPSFWNGVGQIQDVYSPFNHWTHGLNLVLVSPAIGAYFWRERRRKFQETNPD